LGKEEESTEFDRFLTMDRILLAQDETAESWWKKYRFLFLKVHELASEYLVVPATSAGPERQFSRAKRINTPKRVSMKPAKLEALVFLGENMGITEPTLQKMKEKRLAASRSSTQHVTDP
jgi:hypothetical protein